MKETLRNIGVGIPIVAGVVGAEALLHKTVDMTQSYAADLVTHGVAIGSPELNGAVETFNKAVRMAESHTVAHSIEGGLALAVFWAGETALKPRREVTAKQAAITLGMRLVGAGAITIAPAVLAEVARNGAATGLEVGVLGVAGLALIRSAVRLALGNAQHQREAWLAAQPVIDHSPVPGPHNAEDKMIREVAVAGRVNRTLDAELEKAVHEQNFLAKKRARYKWGGPFEGIVKRLADEFDEHVRYMDEINNRDRGDDEEGGSRNPFGRLPPKTS